MPVLRVLVRLEWSALQKPTKSRCTRNTRSVPSLDDERPREAGQFQYKRLYVASSPCKSFANRNVYHRMTSETMMSCRSWKMPPRPAFPVVLFSVSTAARTPSKSPSRHPTLPNVEVLVCRPERVNPCPEPSRTTSLTTSFTALTTSYMTKQQPPLCCGAYGSSPRGTAPQTDGTM